VGGFGFHKRASSLVRDRSSWRDRVGSLIGTRSASEPALRDIAWLPSDRVAGETKMHAQSRRRGVARFFGAKVSDHSIAKAIEWSDDALHVGFQSILSDFGIAAAIAKEGMLPGRRLRGAS